LNMKASVVDLRRRMKEILQALDRNEPVEILYHGKARAVLVPTPTRPGEKGSAGQHPAFGLWKQHAEKRNVSAYLRKLRQRRGDAL